MSGNIWMAEILLKTIKVKKLNLENSPWEPKTSRLFPNSLQESSP